jgi:hypothetical protein
MHNFSTITLKRRHCISNDAKAAKVTSEALIPQQGTADHAGERKLL